MGIDILGIDIMGVDILGVDILPLFTELSVPLVNGQEKTTHLGECFHF